MFDLFGRKRRKQEREKQEREKQQARLASSRAAIAEPVYSKDPREWIALPPPLRSSPQYYAANHSGSSWIVSLRDGHPHVEWKDDWKAPDVRARNLPAFLYTTKGNPSMFGSVDDLCVYQVEDGWLVGCDSGEWGGSLSWYSADGRETYDIPDGDQVGFFLETPMGVLAFAGLAHMGHSWGKVSLIKRADSTQRWSAELFADLTGEPYAAFSDTERSFLLVTSEQLVRIALDGQIDVLVQDAFWGGLYPTSVVIDAADIYIGMRHGVVRIIRDDQKFTTQWLLPNQAFVDAKPDDPPE